MSLPSPPQELFTKKLLQYRVLEQVPTTPGFYNLPYSARTVLLKHTADAAYATFPGV